MSIAERFFPNKQPLYLCDGSAFIYRGFYAYSSMQRLDGFPTSAIYIVARIMLKLLKTEKPHSFCFVLDGITKSFRNELFTAYKQNRTKTPEQLIQQIEPILELLQALGIPILVSENAEADDYIASLALRYQSKGIIIVGVDKDLRQCLSPNVLLWDPASKDERIITEESFIAESKLLPSQWADFQAIIGDSSDNIPGVPGIGPKTAEKIFSQYGTLEEIRDNIDRIDEKIQKKLRPALEDIFIYRELTRLQTTLSIDVEESYFQCTQSTEKAIEILEQYELTSLIKDVQKLIPKETPNKVKNATETSILAEEAGMEVEGQFSLFTLVGKDEKKQDAKKFTEVKDLPKSTGKILALLLQKEYIEIMINSKEYTISYEDSSLAEYIIQAKECITIDCKNIFSLYPTLLESSHTLFKDIALMGYLINPEEREYTIEALFTTWNEQLPEPATSFIGFLYNSSIFFTQRIYNLGLENLYLHVEHPLTYVLAKMEKEGIRIDIEELTTFLFEVQKSLEEKEKKIYSLAGSQFNIRSSQQLGNILFETLGLVQKKKTKTGQSSTSQESLEKLSGSHAIIAEILGFRKLEKLRSTYLEPLPKYADKEKRIHTTFNQLATATGRLSSSNPNLQNIPIRGDMGKRMRQCFCATEGNLLIAADYSQIELRILAYLSKEPTLVEAFANNEDIHTRTASLLYNTEQKDITKTQRQNAKTINFGLLYGMGPQKLARELNISVAEAKEFISIYFSKLGNLKEFYEQIIEKAKESGYVTTLFGRRRVLPEIHSLNEQMFATAKRQAINTVVQGTAADIIKIAMVEIEKTLYYKDNNARLILQVHDELIMEAPVEVAEEIGKKLSLQMSTIIWEGISLPLTVDWGCATTWGDAH